VHATTAVSAALCIAFPLRLVLSHYTDLDWRELPDALTLDGGLIVRRITVGTKRPRYATDADGDWCRRCA